ncbi:MAG: SDR family oxidoreductase [Muribaculaceae bacterium]|nr:SDR family oxidoreductase [Muribaculaceae bacterium]
MQSPFSLTDKTILVTGASSGIGRATAIECSRLGAHLVLTGRNVGRLEETLSMLAGDGHVVIAADLTVEEDIDALVEALQPVDGLVLCSGMGMMTPVQFSTRKKLMEVFDTNFLYPVELMRRMLKKKKVASPASIVAVASMGGTHFFTVGNGAYGASKAALDSFMKFAARELASKSIRVNTVLPAMIDTPLIHRGAVSDEDHAADALTYPLRRYGRPEEVAYAIIYLLSDASAWTTGSSLIIDGGKSLV